MGTSARQKVPFVLTRFQASVAPRPENSDWDEKDALDIQITILIRPREKSFPFLIGHIFNKLISPSTGEKTL
jgi:hypothetical protein